MTASRREVVEAIRDAKEATSQAVRAFRPDAWQEQAYKDGWTAKQLLSHVAITSRLWSFLVGMGNQHASAGTLDIAALLAAEIAAGRVQPAGEISEGGSLDVAAVMAHEIAALDERPVEEVLSEVYANCDRAVDDIESTSDELLTHYFKTPWGTEGTLADLIAISSIQDHLLVHLRDLERAAA